MYENRSRINSIDCASYVTEMHFLQVWMVQLLSMHSFDPFFRSILIYVRVNFLLPIVSTHIIQSSAVIINLNN